MRCGGDLVRRVAVFAQVARVTFNGLAFVVPDSLRIGLYKAAIEYASGEAFVVVCFDRFEIVNGNPGLVADLAQTNTSLLACESQLFAYTRCHLQSLDSWRRVGWFVNPGLSSRAACMNAYNSHFFCNIACAAKRCQTFASQKICVSCSLPPTVVR